MFVLGKKYYISHLFFYIIIILLLIGLWGILRYKDIRRISVNAQTTYDWPQLQNNPQHTGYTSEILGTNFSIVWTRPFQPDKIYPQVQAIVYQNKVFVGSEMGNLYAFNALNGQQLWKKNIGSPILSSVVAANGRIFFGALDGSVYAYDANTGNQIWRQNLSWRLGFVASPVFADSKILLGGQNGIFYALSPESGQVIWQFNAGAPILTAAAWNNNKVYFTTMNMFVFAVSSINGNLVWKSQQIQQMAFKDYWPVVTQGKVILRAMGAGYGVNRTLIVLDEDTGAETTILPQNDTQTMHGTTTPPCVDRNGYLIVPIERPDGVYGSGWGQLSLTTRSIVSSLTDSSNPSAGYGNNDENLNVSCSQNFIFSMHTEEMNANYTGAFNLDTRRWTQFGPGHTNRQMSTNTQGAGGNPASIANGMIFHITWHELVVRKAQ